MPLVRPTLRSLAAEAGVSVTTVSFALRNSPEISVGTRERLQRLASARGYRPDPQIAKLMCHLRTTASARATANVCGLCQHWEMPPDPTGNYFYRLCEGLRRRAVELGYAFDLIKLEDYPRRDQLQRLLASRGVEGLLVLPMRRPTDLSELLDWEMFSTVAVTSTILAPQFHRVIPHHFDNMVLACRELKRAGFRRIGLAMAKAWDARVNHRWSGGLAWQNQFGGTEWVTPLLSEGSNLSLEPEALIRWLVKERPDVVLIESLSYDADVITRALRTLPVRRRPKIVVMNWPSAPAAAGIDQRPERIGIAAIEVLAAILNRGERGIPDLANSTLIDGQWIAGTLNGNPRCSRNARLATQRVWSCRV
jgi:DNA-binding LacI/PurR family transcriptional regulator